VTSELPPSKRFRTQAEWERWLERNHASEKEIWLQFAKKGSDVQTLTYPEAVISALCYGWIDSQGRSGGEKITLQRYTPRGKRSRWSRINREHAERLINEGRMKPAGLAAIEQAKQNGQWEGAYDPPSTATVPEDLQRALRRDKKARDFFATLDSRNRYAILHRLAAPAKPETRTRRIEKYVAMLAAGEKLYP
jgi:uncharacterized protein YdeI (YjbR/CyaY-like superfamily)